MILYLKPLLFVFMIISPVIQESIVRYQSFAIDNKEVVWMQVFHHDTPSDETSDRLLAHLKQKKWIRNAQIQAGELTADLVNYRPDYKRYGGKFMNTSQIVRTGRWHGKVTISFKDGKYRVLLSELAYDATQSATGSGKATIEQHAVQGSLAEFALNDIRTSFRKSRMLNLDILHMSFKDSFTLQVNQLIDSDW